MPLEWFFVTTWHRTEEMREVSVRLRRSIKKGVLFGTDWNFLVATCNNRRILYFVWIHSIIGTWYSKRETRGNCDFSDRVNSAWILFLRVLKIEPVCGTPSRNFSEGLGIVFGDWCGTVLQSFQPVTTENTGIVLKSHVIVFSTIQLFQNNSEWYFFMFFFVKPYSSLKILSKMILEHCSAWIFEKFKCKNSDLGLLRLRIYVWMSFWYKHNLHESMTQFWFFAFYEIRPKSP